MMQESKRQKQVAALINEELSAIFRKLGLNVMDNGMISISSVKVTPDLLEARIYLSFYNLPDAQLMLEKVREKHREIQRELVSKIGKQLRRMPELQYYYDDTLDYVFKMESLFGEIKKQETERNEKGSSNKQQSS
jgi:ribosome-binding factor A